MVDRCDTEPHWFFFTADDRPYGVVVADIQNNRYVKELQSHRALGHWSELRSGNHAAATLDQIMTIWPEPNFTSGEGYVFAEPYDVQAPVGRADKPIVQQHAEAV